MTPPPPGLANAAGSPRLEMAAAPSIYGARLDTGTGELTTSEIAAFITSKALITVRQDDGLDIDAVVERWDESPDLAKFGIGYLLYGLLDCLHRHHCPDWAGALPHLQTQGLAVRPKIARLGGFAASTGRARAEPGTYRHRHFC